MGLFHCQLEYIPLNLLSNSVCLLWTSNSETQGFHSVGNISTYLGGKYVRRYFWISSYYSTACRLPSGLSRWGFHRVLPYRREG